MKNSFRRHCRLFLFALIGITSTSLQGQGNVYLVLGSDTSIWDGLDVTRFNCYYQPDLYSDPTQNAAKVMNTAFRSRFLDSQGHPLVMTWWMHGGNVFRHAANNDVPCNNTMALHLMKQYHGAAIVELGDELTLHYHTWDWTDENGDGIYYWNQARSFSQCREDFDITLCHYLLEEETFPVSFRSGWHYMDNLWQARLDELLPFSMHNAYPAKRDDTTEPTDNIYDWSQAPSTWVPFHPSPDNYQKPGDGRGWNLRCEYMGGVSANTVEDLFVKAASGIDQVACFWSHLPEADFPEQIAKINDLVQQSAAAHPSVTFHYLTAVQAMQAWLKTADRQQPLLTITELTSADGLTFSITTDEPIFQREPFVAVKDVYERYRILSCQPTGENRWQTVQPQNRQELAKVGVAVCDLVGNQAIRIIRYLPDIVFLDNLDAAFHELTGSFSTSSQSAWGPDSRIAILAPGDSAAVCWQLNAAAAGQYHLHLQWAPAAVSASDSIVVVILQDNLQIVKKTLRGPFAARQWLYLTTVELGPGKATSLLVSSRNHSSGTRAFAPDVLRQSPLVVQRRLVVEPAVLSFGRVSAGDTACISLSCTNLGTSVLTLQSADWHVPFFNVNQKWPLVIPSFATVSLPVRVCSETTGSLGDRLILNSDDPLEPSLSVQITAQIDPYFTIIDNDDPGAYEERGVWAKSVAQAEGASSRYSPLNNSGAMAQFSTRLKYAGLYEIQEIVPTTSNASNHALYKIWSGDALVDSIFLDQNDGSGGWKTIGRYLLAANQPIRVQVINAGGHTKGEVLRADAIQFSLLFTSAVSVAETERTGPNTVRLAGNYPNPFNQETAIQFTAERSEPVKIDIYDLRAQWICTLMDRMVEPGDHQIRWDGRDASGRMLPSGLYFCRLKSSSGVKSLRMFLLR